MKRLRTLATVLAFPLMLMACPGDEEDDYDPPEEEGSGSLMGPNASVPSIQSDGPYMARVG